MMDLNNLTDRELDQLLTEWGREQRAVLDLHAQAAEARGRAIIMQRIQELSAKTPARTSVWDAFSLVKQVILAFRVPAGVTASLVLVVGLFGSVTYASQTSLPGDALYPFKLQLEQAQIELLPQGAPRLEKKVAFAQRRLQEFLQLEQKNDTMPLVQQAMLTYREDVKSLTQELADLRGKEDARRLVAVAIRVDDSVAASLKSFKPTTNKEVTATRAALQSASKRAIEVIAESYDQAGLDSTQVSNRIKQNISVTRQEVQSAAAETNNQKPANQFFSDIQQQLQVAEDHLAKRDFGNALFKLNSSQNLINETDISKLSLLPVVEPPSAEKNEPVVIESKKESKPAMVNNIQNNTTQTEIWYSPSKPAYYFDEGDQRIQR